jgi:hypothetical protein
MTESLLEFTEPNLHKIGVPSYDYSTFILFRKSSQIVRKYNAIGISVSILQDLIERGCKLIIIKLDGVARFKISPEDWLRLGIIDQLTTKQEPHAFYPIPKLRRFYEC